MTVTYYDSYGCALDDTEPHMRAWFVRASDYDYLAREVESIKGINKAACDRLEDAERRGDARSDHRY